MKVELGSAVPSREPVAELVTMSAGGMVKTGAAGAMVSTVKLREAFPMLPAASVWRTATVCGPFVSVGVGFGVVQAVYPPP
ncbi:MAG: hypothetical protein Q7V62_02070 [Actinomycetota bacterium]|nr:hypothetical protein [Actinomycetota bacterium]